MYQAQKVSRKFWKYCEHPFNLCLGTRLDRDYVEFFSIPGDYFDRDDITVYQDGSVFVEYVQYYPEYWATFSKGWFVGDEPCSTPPRYDIDWIADYHYSASVNSCCYLDWFKSVDVYLKKENPYCGLPDFKLHVQVACKHWKYAPLYYAECHTVDPDKLQGIESIEGYDFWLRAFYCRVNPSLYSPSPLFDIYYPKKKRNWQNIEVVVSDFKSNIKRVFKWRHGSHGLFKLLIEGKLKQRD